MNPPLKKVKRKKYIYIKNPVFPLLLFFFEFQWKIYFKNCLYIKSGSCTGSYRKENKKRLSIYLACNERFVSTK